MKAVLDTNVLISAVFWRGVPYRCVLAAEGGLFQPVLAEEILDELRAKLLGKFEVPSDEVDAICACYRSIATMVVLEGKGGWVAADPDDDKFIETALAGDADFIVSGDRDLLALDEVEGVSIMSCRAFLDLLAEAEA